MSSSPNSPPESCPHCGSNPNATFTEHTTRHQKNSDDIGRRPDDSSYGYELDSDASDRVDPATDTPQTHLGDVERQQSGDPQKNPKKGSDGWIVGFGPGSDGSPVKQYRCPECEKVVAEHDSKAASLLVTDSEDSS